MSTTQPIRKSEELNRLKCYYDGDTPLAVRNQLLILMGLNTALRVTDMLHLKWTSVYDYENKRQKTHLELTEQKTGKQTRIALNGVLKAPAAGSPSTGIRPTASCGKPRCPAVSPSTSAAIPCGRPLAITPGSWASRPLS